MTVLRLIADGVSDASYQSILQAGTLAVMSLIAFFIKRSVNQFDASVELLSKRLNRNCRRLRRVELKVNRIPKRSQEQQKAREGARPDEDSYPPHPQ